MSIKKYPFEFPPDQYQDCQTLNELTIENLPHDGSLGRILNYPKGGYVWQTDDRQDKIYSTKHAGQNLALLVQDFQ